MLPHHLRVGLFGLVTIGLMSSPAAAFQKVNLSGTRSKEYIQGLCSQVGGQYLEGQGQYGCMTNCNNTQPTNDACGINCSEQTNQCYGWKPSRVRSPRSDIGILHPPTRAAR